MPSARAESLWRLQHGVSSDLSIRAVVKARGFRPERYSSLEPVELRVGAPVVTLLLLSCSERHRSVAAASALLPVCCS